MRVFERAGGWCGLWPVGRHAGEVGVWWSGVGEGGRVLMSARVSHDGWEVGVRWGGGRRGVDVG